MAHTLHKRGIYSGGFRIGEMVKLRISDLQPEVSRVFVRNGKGKKDCCTILSPVVWEKIKAYNVGPFQHQNDRNTPPYYQKRVEKSKKPDG